jgi:hypothetical protein
MDQRLRFRSGDSMGVRIAEAVIMVSHIQFDDSGTVDIQ